MKFIFSLLPLLILDSAFLQRKKTSLYLSATRKSTREDDLIATECSPRTKIGKQ